MPTIFFYGPKLEKNEARQMVKSFTEAASKVTGISEKAFVVYLRPTEHEEVAVGGELLADKKRS